MTSKVTSRPDDGEGFCGCTSPFYGYGFSCLVSGACGKTERYVTDNVFAILLMYILIFNRLRKYAGTVSVKFLLTSSDRIRECLMVVLY